MVVGGGVKAGVIAVCIRVLVGGGGESWCDS